MLYCGVGEKPDELPCLKSDLRAKASIPHHVISWRLICQDVTRLDIVAFAELRLSRRASIRSLPALLAGDSTITALIPYIQGLLPSARVFIDHLAVSSRKRS